MKDKIIKVIGIIFIIAISVSISYFLLKEETKIAFIDINKVFQKFDYKMELEKKLIKTSEMRTQKLDTLEFELKILSKQLEAEGAKDKEKLGLFQAKREYYFQKKQEFDEDNTTLTNQYNEQVLKQLTQYVNDYGKENSYNYILGAEGGGSIMYGKPKNDITEDIITYINNKYKGVK